MSPATKTKVRFTIDGKAVSAKAGETVLSAAKRAGIEIPALCHQEGAPAWGACRLCLIEVKGADKLQASCATSVADGLVVHTQSKRVRAKRESYLKMYLSDHNAYCEAPCSSACPTHIDIPAYLSEVASGDMAAAAAIVRRELPFAGIFGRICPCAGAARSTTPSRSVPCIGRPATMRRRRCKPRRPRAAAWRSSAPAQPDSRAPGI